MALPVIQERVRKDIDLPLLKESDETGNLR
jgi:hypothetical protein